MEERQPDYLARILWLSVSVMAVAMMLFQLLMRCERAKRGEVENEIEAVEDSRLRVALPQ